MGWRGVGGFRAQEPGLLGLGVQGPWSVIRDSGSVLCFWGFSGGSFGS